MTGPIPGELGSLVNLESLRLGYNELTGPIPGELGSLVNLESLLLDWNALTGPIPGELGNLVNLKWLYLEGNDLIGPIPVWLGNLTRLRRLFLGDNELTGPIPAELGSLVNLEWLHLGWSQLTGPIPGEFGNLGADVVHLIVGESDGGFYSVCGIANLPGPFGITLRDCGGITFAHELGHNMGLRHDRFRVQVQENSVSSHPAYGYVNQRIFEAGAPPSSRWRTIMSYGAHCGLADVACSELPRFSNPRQRYGGDPLGTAHGVGSGVTGPADAAAVLNATGPAVAAWRDRPTDAANRPPVAVGTLPDRRLASVGSVLDVDVSQAFVDPDDDALAYTVSSGGAVGGEGGRVGSPRDADGGGRGRGDDPGDGDRSGRTERVPIVLRDRGGRGRPGSAGQRRVGSGGAGGALRRDPRCGLDGQHQLEDVGAAGRVARRDDRRRRPGHGGGPVRQRVGRLAPARVGALGAPRDSAAR